MTAKATAPRRRSTADLEVELLDRLDRAMVLWSRRSQEPAALVDRTLDDLHAAWAAARFAAGDHLDVARATPKGRGAGGRRRDVHQTRIARGEKAKEDDLRERYIVKHYAAALRRGRSPKQARELVAADIRSGKHLPAMRQLDLDYRPAAYGGTYSEKSVARVLKKFDAPRK
jgi:hypothetical protein